MKKKVVSMLLAGTLLMFGLGASPEAKPVEAESVAETQEDSGEISLQYQSYCEEIGQKYAICPELLMSIIEQESDGNPLAIGTLGEVGLMQIYPKFHQDRMNKLGVYSLYDPYSNILVGADYLSELFREYQDMATVLMVYNGSSDAIDRGNTYTLTEYAETIINRTQELERAHNK